MGGSLLAESSDVAMHDCFDAGRGRHLLLADSQVREGGLEELLVEPAVGHGAVEAANGPDANGEGFGLQRPPHITAALELQWRRRQQRAETFRLGLVEPPPLLWSCSLSILNSSSQS